MTIGKNIAIKRKELNWTQKQLAEILNVSDKTISSWENERTYPDIAMLIQLSDTFNLSLDKLIREDLKMVHEIDDAIRIGKSWGKWNKLVIGISVLAVGYMLVSISWLLWTNVRQAELDNYSWEQAEIKNEQLDHIGLYVKRNGVYVYLSNYQTKYSTPYLSFDKSIREVTVKNEEGIALVIKNRNNLIFYNGKGEELNLNSRLEPVKGTSKNKEMSKEKQEMFKREYREEIEAFYLNGLALFKDMNGGD